MDAQYEFGAAEFVYATIDSLMASDRTRLVRTGFHQCHSLPSMTAQGQLKAAPNGPYDEKDRLRNCGADNSGRSEWHRRL